MIEMDEQFQQEFGFAMASLRAVHQGLIGTADNARGEARALVADHRVAEAITCHEVAHAYWTAANRVRPAISLFEDADRRAASLMEQAPKPDELSLAERAYQARVKYLEDQLARLDTALRGRPATLDEKIRETETTEDLIDAAVRLIEDRPERERADREHERAETLAKVTTKAAGLFGALTLPEIIPAIRKALGKPEMELEVMAGGTLIAGEWISAAGQNRKIYVGRFSKLDPDGPVIDYVCDCGNGGGSEGYHVVSTKLNRDTVRLPTGDEILAFSQLTEASGLLKLEGDE